MKKREDYTSRARRFAAQHQVLTYIFTQAGFWLIAYVLLAVIIHLSSLNLTPYFSNNIDMVIWPNIAVGAITGLLYGSTLGLLDYFFDRQFFRNKPLGRIILMKSLISLILLVLCFNFMQFVLYDKILAPNFDRRKLIIDHTTWRNLFLIIFVYSFFMTLVITFIIQMNKKYGPGVLLPLLLGKYRDPKEEERIFMFMDLKSSTAIAEELGHLKYSGFIRDSFMDINQILNAHNAEIYQYVGDEIVISWRLNDDKVYLQCVQFFFACEKQFENRGDYYMTNYGLIPCFKAGMHMGKVTAVEIGEIKRDIAYHGDTLNTTARIQSMCNHYEKKFLVSDFFLNESGINAYFDIEELGLVMLKGKKMPVGIWSVGQKQRPNATSPKIFIN